MKMPPAEPSRAIARTSSVEMKTPTASGSRKAGTLARVGSIALLLFGATAGCNAVLGVDEAKYDPSLDPLVAGGSAGAGTAGSAGTTSDGGAGGGEANDPSCVAYCDLVEQNCTVELEEYPNKDTCLNMCRRMDNGPAGALTGNTVECRAAHAALAATELDKKVDHCLAAGPLGNGTCGDLCGAFCALNLAYCVPPRVGIAAYASPSECLTECNKLPFEKLSQSAYFVVSEKNNLNCRDYHLQAAYRSDSAALTHCSHTSVNSTTCF